MLDYGDNVMADGVTLNIPPYKGSRSQLTATETEESAIIAVRIHEVTALGRLKINIYLMV